jgi:hypothetical protein
MSQRHRIWQYGSASNGEIHAQGVTARSLIVQVVDDPSNPNVLMPREGEAPPDYYTVPHGPSGGPLQGSSLSGAIPVDANLPVPVPPEPDTNPVLTSIDPYFAMIGTPDITMRALGTQFTDACVILFNNGPEPTTFVSATELTTIVKPSLAEIPLSVPVAVQLGEFVTSAVTFEFTATSNPKPVLNSINPSSAPIGSADLTMNVTGSRFVENTVIVFDNLDATTTFVNDGKVTMTVQPSTVTQEKAVPVWVRNPDGLRSDLEKTFTFTTTQAELQEREFPIGPLIIAYIEDHADGIAYTLVEEGTVQVGDHVTVEATGNTSVNGNYTVLAVEGAVIVADNDFELSAPIEAKGRLTVTS